MRPKRDAFTPTTRGESQPKPLAQPEGFTKEDLLEASALSPKTFDTIRKAARVRGPSHGGLNWVFSIEDIEALIHRAESGKFTEKGPAAAAAWRRLLAEGLPPESSEDEE